MEENKVRGKFIVIDGLDGVGKGTAILGIRELWESQGKRVFDLDKYWQENHMHPEFYDVNSKYFVDLNSFDFIVSSEPTYCLVGRTIRDEIVANNGREYSALSTANAYALDREVLYKRVLLPALESGKDILQSRSVSTSIAYQKLQAERLGENLSIEDIISIEGNAFALSHPMDLLIIPTIKNVEELLQRLEKRKDKDDNCKFENLDFQIELKKRYDSQEFQNVFKSRGVKLSYIDASTSIEQTKKEAIEATHLLAA